MEFNVILNGTSQTRQFPIIRLKDGTPCIVGDDSLNVFLPDGGCTATHPCTNSTQSLYEVHLGDIIGVCETEDDTVYLGTYLVDDISDTQVRCTRI